MEYAENREYGNETNGAVESHNVDKKGLSLKSEVEAGRSVPCHQAVAAERRGNTVFLDLAFFGLIPLPTYHTMFDLPNAKRYVSMQFIYAFLNVPTN